MPRNGSGTYTLPSGNPVVTLTTITSTWANTTLSDIATALTGSLAADGQTGLTGPFKLQDGTVSAPGLTWATETTSGWYRAAAGTFGFTVQANLALQVNANRQWTFPAPISGAALTVNGSTGSLGTGVLVQSSGASGYVVDGALGLSSQVEFRQAGAAAAFIGVALAAGQLATGSVIGDWVLRTQGGSIIMSANSGTTAQFKLTAAGNFTLAAPASASGTTLQINGPTGTGTFGLIVANTGAGSIGADIRGGTSSSDWSLIIRNAAATILWNFGGDGSLFATGLTPPGNGNLNVNALFVGNNPVYSGAPVVVSSTTRTLLVSDSNKAIQMVGGGIVIPNSTSFVFGTIITFANFTGAAQSITPASGVSLLQAAGTGTSGTRTLAAVGQCSIVLWGTNTWIISGPGVT